MASLENLVAALEALRRRIACLERQGSPPLALMQAEHAAFQACELLIIAYSKRNGGPRLVELDLALDAAKEAVRLRKEAHP